MTATAKKKPANYLTAEHLRAVATLARWGEEMVIDNNIDATTRRLAKEGLDMLEQIAGLNEGRPDA